MGVAVIIVGLIVGGFVMLVEHQPVLAGVLVLLAVVWWFGYLAWIIRRGVVEGRKARERRDRELAVEGERQALNAEALRRWRAAHPDQR